MPVAADRIGLAQAVADVSDEIIFGDLIIGLGVPIPVKGIERYRKLARLLLPFVSYFPLSMLFYGSEGTEHQPKYGRYWRQADLIAAIFCHAQIHAR